MIQPTEKRRARVASRLRNFGATFFMTVLLFVMVCGGVNTSSRSHQFFDLTTTVRAEGDPSPSPGCETANDSQPCRPADDDGPVKDLVRAIGSFLLGA